MREHKIGEEKMSTEIYFDERRRLDVEMDVGEPLLDIETWTLLVDTGEISVA